MGGPGSDWPFLGGQLRVCRFYEATLCGFEGKHFVLATAEGVVKVDGAFRLAHLRLSPRCSLLYACRKERLFLEFDGTWIPSCPFFPAIFAKLWATSG